jgi:choline dehydrogenase
VLAAALIQPQSVGSLTLRTNNPTLPPVLQPNYLSHHADLHTLLAAMKLLRQMAHAQPFASLCAKEIVPGPQVKDNEKSLIEHLRLAANTAYHYSGTCKMGIDSLAVVDPHLCVRGLDGLRVVDASIMPSSVRGNFYAPVVMLAEKAAALLREETPFSALSSIQNSTTNFLIS